MSVGSNIYIFFFYISLKMFYKCTFFFFFSFLFFSFFFLFFIFFFFFSFLLFFLLLLLTIHIHVLRKKSGRAITPPCDGKLATTTDSPLKCHWLSCGRHNRSFIWRHIEQILQVIIPATAMLISSSHRTVLEKKQKTKYYINFFKR